MNSLYYLGVLYSFLDIEGNNGFEMYEMLSNKGVKLGAVEIIRTTEGEVVHGKELLSHERKVLVRDVYSTAILNTNDEFVSGAYLRVNKLLLCKLLFQKENSKKRGRGHKVHHQQNGKKVRER